MISKEKLLGGYIKNEEGELMDLFIEAVKYYFPDARTSVFIEFPQCQPTFFAFDCYLNRCMVYGSLSTNMTELTLDDFKTKPKTKVTYELVTDMTNNEIAKSMIDGEVFYSKDGKVSFRWDGSMFVNNIDLPIQFHGLFYRKVEKEIDWHTEAIEFVDKSNCICLNDTINFMLTKPNSETFDEYDSEVLELCRLILRSIGEL